jgi:hypothetical protein
MVDRADQRRDLLRTIAPATPPQAPANVVLITGADKTGKSLLARWSFERFGIVGRQLHYVHFPKGHQINFVDFLRAIRDGARGTDRSGCGPGCPRLDPAAFHEFNRRLNFYLRGEIPPDAGGSTSDEMRPWEALDDSVIGRILGDFRLALLAAAGGGSLVVVLDNVDVNDAQFTDYVVPHFVRPVAQATDGKLRLVFVMNEERARKLGLDDPALAIPIVQVSSFSKDEFSPLMREYLRLCGAYSNRVDEIIKLMAPGVPDPWSAVWFEHIGFARDLREG